MSVIRSSLTVPPAARVLVAVEVAGRLDFAHAVGAGGRLSKR